MHDKKNSWFTIIKNEAEKSVVLNIHGFIGMYEISAESLMNQVNGIEGVETIDVHINSYGGEVFEGVAIYNWLLNHKATVNTTIDSVAASIASLIFLAGEKRTVYDTSMGMIHLPVGLSYGNSKQMRKDADILDKIDNGTIRKAYRKAVGDKLSDEKINELMENETWLDSDELIEYGFATDKVKSDDDEQKTNDKYKAAAAGIDIKALGFKKMPERLAVALGYNGTVSIPVNVTEPKTNNKQKEGAMPIDNQTNSQPTAEEIKAKAQAEERKRISGIQAAAAALGVSGEPVTKLIESGTSIEDAMNELIAINKIAKQQPVDPQAVTVPVSITVDERDNYRNGTVASLCAVAGIAIDAKERHAAMQSELPRNLHGLIRTELVREGKMTASAISSLQPTDLGRHAVRLAKNVVSTGTGDLTNILADTINKSMSIGYTQAPSTYQAWVKILPVKDFRAYTLAKLSAFSDMDVIPEGFPFKHGALSDLKETGSISVKGKTLTIPWQVFVNDDLAAMARVPQLIGASFAFRQNKDVYDTLYGTGTGPTMTEADSNGSYACFTTSRGNLASTGGAPSITTLSAGRKAMRNMTAPKGEQTDGPRPLNLVPQFIIHGTSLETTTEQLIGTRTDITSAGSLAINPFAVGGRTPLQIVVDAYLETKTSTGWYLAASPAMIETIVLLALDGQVQPTIRSEESRVGEALGINWDIYGAYGVMCGDFRGLYFNAGA